MVALKLAVDGRALFQPASGIGVYTQNLLKELRNYQLEITVLTHKPLKGEKLDNIHYIADSVPSGVVWQQTVLPKKLKQFDIFWSPIQTLPFYTPIPSLVTVHDLTVITFPETHTLKVKLSQIPFLRRTISNAKVIVTPSKATAEDLINFFPHSKNKVEVIYNGVSGSFTYTPIMQRERIRNSLGYPNGFILFVGTLEPRKNLVVLLEAWKAINCEFPAYSLPLVIVGSPGWKSKKVVKMIKKAGPNVNYIGVLNRENLISYYRAASLFVYPSLSEGFGLPVIEAMATGTPVITSNRSSLSEITNGCAITVEPEDPSELARAIIYLLNDKDKQEKLSILGYKHSCKFSWTKAANQLYNLFCSICIQ